MKKASTQYEITNQILKSNAEALGLKGITKTVLSAMSTFFNDKEIRGVFTLSLNPFKKYRVWFIISKEGY